jgi:2-polyprenyl-3-methyl-5-hydroxy-6-metoxy-1,4-benzoquinol methylase
MGIMRRLGLLDRRRRSLRVFEIGCSEGMLLRELAKHGHNAIGCEMNRAVAVQGIQNLSVEILTDPFEELELPTQTFDLVISFHTLEHMRRPTAVLSKIADILRDDGAVLIEVPCGEQEYDNTDHLHFFNERSLKLLLESYFAETEVLQNTYTNSSGVHIASIYGVGRRRIVGSLETHTNQVTSCIDHNAI